jgi:hypothetical protein
MKSEPRNWLKDQADNTFMMHPLDKVPKMKAQLKGPSFISENMYLDGIRY